MLKVDPEQRATAEECLHHKFFEDDCNYMDSSGDTLNLNQTLLGIKSKYKQTNNLKFQDSINFNANPDITGTTESYKSISNMNPSIRPKIDSISSKNQGSNLKNPMYRQAL